MQNRVEKIRSLLHCNCSFVTTNVNLADIGTHLMTPSDSMDFDLSWNGPCFFGGCQEGCPSQEFALSQKESYKKGFPKTWFLMWLLVQWVLATL